jgi:hypothetical protein
MYHIQIYLPLVPATDMKPYSCKKLLLRLPWLLRYIIHSLMVELEIIPLLKDSKPTKTGTL